MHCLEVEGDGEEQHGQQRDPGGQIDQSHQRFALIIFL